MKQNVLVDVMIAIMPFASVKTWKPIKIGTFALMIMVPLWEDVFMLAMVTKPVKLIASIASRVDRPIVHARFKKLIFLSI